MWATLILSATACTFGAQQPSYGKTWVISEARRDFQGRKETLAFRGPKATPGLPDLKGPKAIPGLPDLRGPKAIPDLSDLKGSKGRKAYKVRREPTVQE
jgi:hypothetical protein